MIYLEEVSSFLDAWLAVDAFPPEQNGVFHPSSRGIQRMGLVLEPATGLEEWVTEKRLDALFLHRPWRLDLTAWPVDIGIVAYHTAFDERLTIGYNRALADIFSMAAVEVLGWKEGRPLGMAGEIPPQSQDQFRHGLLEEFGSITEIINRKSGVLTKVAFVGGITDTLVREAASKGVEVYVTGQMRQPARTAAEETGMQVVAVGHQASEALGLRLLANKLGEAFPSVVFYPWVTQ